MGKVSDKDQLMKEARGLVKKFKYSGGVFIFFDENGIASKLRINASDQETVFYLEAAKHEHIRHLLEDFG